jgi:hypothetical protein
MVIIPPGFGGMADGIPDGILGGILIVPICVGTMVGFRNCIAFNGGGGGGSCLLLLLLGRECGDTDRECR